MKIAMPKNGELLNQHFGKSKSFAIVVVENNEIKDISEISTEMLQHNHKGLADFLEKENINVIITGGIGQGAYKPLIEKGFKVIRGASGNIKDIIKDYLENKLEDKNVMCSHHGDHHH